MWRTWLARAPQLDASWAFSQAFLLLACGAILSAAGEWWFGLPLLLGAVCQALVGIANAKRGNWV
jgi:hypothetical protein